MNTISIDQVLNLYLTFGPSDYIGENISQIEHMSQVAELAMAQGYDDEVVLAAFFHDIGNLCASKLSNDGNSGLGIENHEKVGANYLRALGFPERIAALVEHHVDAKRYLCYRRPEYFQKLSEASRKTLVLQGGVMNEEEALAFEKSPLAAVMIKMREWDDQAKMENVPLLDFQLMKEKMLSVLRKRQKFVTFFQ